MLHGIGYLLATGRYSLILRSIVIGEYFFIVTPNMIPDQTAVGTVHMITVLTSVVRPLPADDGRASW